MTAGSHLKDTELGAFTHSVLAARFANESLAGTTRWAKGLGWMRWDGRRWSRQADEAVVEAARLWVLRCFEVARHRMKISQGDNVTVGKWISTASASNLRAIVGLAKGIEGVHTDAAAFDAHPDLLNVANGVVDLRGHKLLDHDPELLMTRIAHAAYRPGARHPDWDAALEAIPDECRSWAQLRYGQATTGHMTPDDVLIVQQGAGENGKTTITGAIAKTIGDFYVLISDRVLLAHPGDHPTELMDLRGARLALVEETPEARRLSVARLKKTVGTPQISARYIRQDSVTFDATHSLFLSTNYRPIVEETDHGTWRRLKLLRFPYRWRKPYEQLESPTDRRGDPGLRQRLEEGAGGQHEAVLAWLVDGAVAWYALDKTMPEPPRLVEADSWAWRAESDVILAYADERLCFDADAHVMSTELLADLNEWQVAHSQRPWGDKTLAARFGDHEEAVAHQVEKRLIRATDIMHGTLSRRPLAGLVSGVPLHLPPPTTKYNAWLGVRFRADSDDDEVAVLPPINTGPPRLPRQPQLTPSNSSHETYTNEPRHPRQTILAGVKAPVGEVAE